MLGASVATIFVVGIYHGTLALRTCRFLPHMTIVLTPFRTLDMDLEHETIHHLYGNIAARTSPMPCDPAIFTLYNYTFQSGPLACHSILSEVGVEPGSVIHCRLRFDGGAPSGKQFLCALLFFSRMC